MSIKPTMKAVALDEVSPLLLGLIDEGWDKYEPALVQYA